MSRPNASAIDRAVGFLLAAQDADGAWRDFNLLPGQAEAWTTAYVGQRLLTILGPRHPALAAAVRFLERAHEPGGGWGYNRRCPPDADSTAVAILFLETAGAPAAPVDFAALARFQHESGGFRTYQRKIDDGWGLPHPEVTATALRALSLRLPSDHHRIRSGLAWLERRLSERAAAYWWPSPLYLALEVERLRSRFPQLSPPAMAAPTAEIAFERALACERALLRREGSASAHARALLALQSADGGWPSTPILRVTDRRARDGAEPPALASPVRADHRRSFVTATALSAVTAFHIAHETGFASEGDAPCPTS
jgi:hypothetical protein